MAMLVVSFLLIFSEFARWWRGHETHTFAVEKGVGHDLQINLDIVIPMKCDDIHINVQDAAGDRILAATMLKRDPTMWSQWVDARGVHKLGMDANGKIITGEEYHEHEEGFGEEHVHDIIAAAGGGSPPRRASPGLPADGFADHLRDGCIGTIAEVFDGDAPHEPRGTAAQAWSVAELLRVLHELDTELTPK